MEEQTFGSLIALKRKELNLSQRALAQKITTESDVIKNYFLAEEYHQQYLDKNPNGYCGIGGTGCEFKI